MAKNYSLLPDAVAMYTQTEAMKEVKDMSKNLVTGEFDRDYMGGSKKKKPCLIALVVVVGALAFSLTVLTVVRELQIARLRSEVDQLTVDMIAMSANVKSLNQKLRNRLDFSEFRNVEDTIYADGDEDNISNEHKDETGAIDKLHDLTVMENDEIPDDEDLYDDDDDEESGYWYEDYDTRREKAGPGTTNMVHLKPEEMLGSVVTVEQERPPSNIREIKRMLNQGTASEKQEVLKPLPVSDGAQSRDKRSVFPDSSANMGVVDDFAAPRFVAKSEERRKNKKYSANEDSTAKMFNFPLHTVSRTIRNSDDAQRRPFVAAHFHGNTSHLNPEIHEHYKGNGLVRVAHEAAHNVWYPSQWTSASPHPRPTLTRNGHIHVHHTGVYLVYVQIYYLDSHDVISWVLHRTNADIEGRETLLQCAQSAHSSERLEKPNSCFSAAALFLKQGDRLAVRNTGGDRHSLMEPEKSFIGLVKLADAEDPNEEL